MNTSAVWRGRTNIAHHEIPKFWVRHDVSWSSTKIRHGPLTRFRTGLGIWQQLHCQFGKLKSFLFTAMLRKFGKPTKETRPPTARGITATVYMSSIEAGVRIYVSESPQDCCWCSWSVARNKTIKLAEVLIIDGYGHRILFEDAWYLCILGKYKRRSAPYYRFWWSTLLLKIATRHGLHELSLNRIDRTETNGLKFRTAKHSFRAPFWRPAKPCQRWRSRCRLTGTIFNTMNQSLLALTSWQW
jgi:hypothetical protein